VKLGIVLSLAFASVSLASGLEAIKAETNLEKRSKLALEYANSQIDAARQAYSAGNLKGSTAALSQVCEGVNLSIDALDETHKDARRSPKAFKRAEVNIREMIRRLKSLEDDFSVDDRGEILKTEQRLQEVHDDLITRIMTKRR
jgi:hypothetical protein